MPPRSGKSFKRKRDSIQHLSTRRIITARNPFFFPSNPLFLLCSNQTDRLLSSSPPLLLHRPGSAPSISPSISPPAKFPEPTRCAAPLQRPSGRISCASAVPAPCQRWAERGWQWRGGLLARRLAWLWVAALACFSGMFQQRSVPHEWDGPAGRLALPGQG